MKNMGRNTIKSLVIAFLSVLCIANANAYACRNINVSTSEALVNALQNTQPCDQINIRQGIYDLSALYPYSPLILADRVEISGEGSIDTTLVNLPNEIQGKGLKINDMTLSNTFRQDVRFAVNASRFKSIHLKGNYSGIWGSRWKIEGVANKLLYSEISDMKLEVIGTKNIVMRTVIHPWVDRSGTLLPLIITGNNNVVRNSTIVANAPIARGIWITGSENAIFNTIIQSVSTTDQGNAIYVQSGVANKINYSLIDFTGSQEVLAEAGAEIVVGGQMVRDNPLFTYPEGSDFHLQAQSPAINAGVPTQLDPDGTQSDIGAFYYQP